MKWRTQPAELDRFRYDPDAVRAATGGPTLRAMLVTACYLGANESIHDDEELAEEFAATCERHRLSVQNAMYLELSVPEARRLYFACMSAWEYADKNNYGSDGEDDEDNRLFGQYGSLLLHALTWPWTTLLPDNGEHGFTRIGAGR